jgi:Holliday junction DNA helicase RuvA
MISYLKWKVIELEFSTVTILTNSWVWYEVWINELSYSKISLDEEFWLYIYHYITENNQYLYGFIKSEEKKIFSELIKISWVWWKVAIQILSLWSERLLQAVKWWDNRTIESIKWVWKKMAEKIILELKDKEFWISFIENKSKNNENSISTDLYVSIKSTLTNMWYNSRDIDRVLLELPENMNNAKDIIPFVIKELS